MAPLRGTSVAHIGDSHIKSVLLNSAASGLLKVGLPGVKDCLISSKGDLIVRALCWGVRKANLNATFIPAVLSRTAGTKTAFCRDAEGIRNWKSLFTPRRFARLVDVPNAAYTNSIGSPELIKVWKDPDFDPALRAFYYVRVIEIPTPRWTAYDAKYFGVTMPKKVPMTTTERAYASPI
jgi:uncharacterized protein DUF3604